jgi:hypothetical protein
MNITSPSSLRISPSNEAFPPQAILGKLVDGPDFFDAGHFAPNPRFIDFLHDVINRHATNCPTLLAEARRQQEGNLFIIDGRTPTPAGNLPPQDIIGAVEIHAGAVTGYQRNPNYRLFTTSGLMILDSWFQSRLLEEIEKIVAHVA